MTDTSPIEERDSWTIVLSFFAIGNLAMGIWMLAEPVHWYLNLPAGVPDTGPANEHFIRDLGSLFFVMGLGLVAAAFRRELRLPVLAGVLAWNLMHCAVHVTDILAGRLDASHWLIDTPGVFAPTLIIALITRAIAKQQRQSTPSGNG